ncbi:MAG: hypothetical protein NWE76_09545 [Candidatus Bathyarchaeota archaeon]|nr:hypothetical protein [Candidatus Bathyarchaeota archaeon]
MSHESDEDRQKRKRDEKRWIVEGIKGTTKRRKKTKFKRITIQVPSRLHSRLKKRAKEVGCSVSSLVKNYIHNGLEGVVVSGSYTRTVSQTVKQEAEFTVRAKKQPANYAQPAYFKELKAVLEKRRKKKR